MQQGGSQSYGAPPPDMNPFAAAGTARSRADHVLGGSGSEHLQQQLPGASAQQAPPPPLAEAASPIASRAPAPPPKAGSLDELGAAPGAPVGFPDEDALAAAGEEAERGGAPGNRWPRQETLALLKIRSEMDAAFRDATLKAPLWEDVSRKLAGLGYRRSAKKCKEKFENVHKYYKRTKDGRAGRQDGKSYRFFSQLEALHSSGGGASSTPAAPVPAASAGTPNTVPSSIGMVGSSSGNLNPTPLNAIPPTVGTAPRVVPDPMAAVSGPPGGTSFSATSSSSTSESEEDTEEGLTGETRKRKRRSGGGSGSGRKMMAFFEELMRQVMERQEAMQQRFLEAIEKREQDRMIREEAWKRQEAARLTREHEMMAQERAMSASRDAAIIAFLQKMTGQTVPVPAPAPAPVSEAARPQPLSQQHPPPAPVSPPPPEQTRLPPPQRSQGQPQQPQQVAPLRAQAATIMDIVPVPEASEVVLASGAGGSGTEPASSRWPKSEVHALIKLRTELEARYQEAGPKGPLWEEIATRMQRTGYNRSAKRCKEKWENINKYFKKVKESNKKRPEDSKTCPYFHELDALYRRKHHGSGGGAGSSKQQEPSETHPQQPPPLQSETEGKSDVGGGDNNSNGDRNGGGNHGGNGGSSLAQKAQTSNGGVKPGVLDEGMGGSGSVKKPEDIVKELMDQQQRQRQHHQAMMSDHDRSEEIDGDDTEEQDGDEDDEDEEDGDMGFRIHYQQRAGVNGTTPNGAAGGKELAAAAAGSFMAMMQ